MNINKLVIKDLFEHFSDNAIEIIIDNVLDIHKEDMNREFRTGDKNEVEYIFNKLKEMYGTPNAN